MKKAAPKRRLLCRLEAYQMIGLPPVTPIIVPET